MATNEILPFAQGVGANVQTQVDYAAEVLRDSGNVAGIARSAVNNKALRQSSVLASALAQYIADNQTNNITDSLTPATIAGYLLTAVRNGVKNDPNFSALLSTNGYQKLPSGLIVQWASVLNDSVSTAPITWPVTFPNSILNVQVSLFQAGLATGRGTALTRGGETSATGANAFITDESTGSGATANQFSVQYFAIGY